MKPGDVVMIYMDPKACTTESGQATLVEKIKDHSSDMEEWLICYINRPCTQCKVLIKNNNETNKTKD